jgi:organic hydroperoxide reductase OsmC/OhrA
MIKEKYTNIINMFEKSKKIEEDVKMKRSSKKRPIVKINKNKENNEDEIKLESLTKLINHSNQLCFISQKNKKINIQYYIY